MLSERRWSDTSSALKFFRTKTGGHSSSASSSSSSSSSSAPSTPSASPAAASCSSRSSSSYSCPVSPPVVTIISDDFVPADSAHYLFHRNSLPSESSSLSNGSIDGIGNASADAANNSAGSSSSTTSNHSSDDSVPDFPAGELKSGSSATESFIKRFWRRKKSLTINEYDPSFKVVYLGNVLTGWAKGEGCVDRPLATLWKNYKAQNGKQEIQMKLTISNSGLKAVTKEHGLTEYWSNRVTFCNVHPRFPKVFCWVYRHEGRRLKQELRCHAVLCPNEAKAAKLAQALQERVQFALQEFRRDKLNRQKARLSLANCVYDVPSLPRRKQLLSTGMSNYRPPLERSKSAPKLKSIEEGLEEPALEALMEEEVEVEEASTGASGSPSAISSGKSIMEEPVGRQHQQRGTNAKEEADDDEDGEDEVSFAYCLVNSRKCDHCPDTVRCRCDQEPGLPDATVYGDLPGQLLDIAGGEEEEGEGEEEEDQGSESSSSCSSSASPPTGARLLPRGSLPGQIEPGPVRAAPSPKPSRSSFSMGSPVCPGKKRKCAAGLCDQPFCGGRATSNLLLGAELARLCIADSSHPQRQQQRQGAEDDDGVISTPVEVECNNNRLLVSSTNGKHNKFFTTHSSRDDKQEDDTAAAAEEARHRANKELPEEREIMKAVTIAGLVGCFRQSKA